MLSYIEETEILEELDISFNSLQAAGAESIANVRISILSYYFLFLTTGLSRR
jgi:hypothetical protein